MNIPAGTEASRPFLPARDLAQSRAFYDALGFTRILDGEVVIYSTGNGGFILQNYYQKDWAENTMLQLLVDDLDAWWQFIQSLDLPGRFGVAAPKAPSLQSWGLRVAYVYDPAGILWHITER